jgi:hypothetical protein
MGADKNFFSKEMRTPTRRTRLPNHVSNSTTHVGQDHAATGVPNQLAMMYLNDRTLSILLLELIVLYNS